MILLLSEYEGEIYGLLEAFSFHKYGDLYKYRNLLVYVNRGAGSLNLAFRARQILDQNSVSVALLFGLAGDVTHRFEKGQFVSLKQVKLMNAKRPLFNPIDLRTLQGFTEAVGVTLLDEFDFDSDYLSLFGDIVDRESYLFARALCGDFGVVLRCISDGNEQEAIVRIKKEGFNYEHGKLLGVAESLMRADGDELYLEIVRYTGLLEEKTVLALKRFIQKNRLSFTMRQSLYRKIRKNTILQRKHAHFDDDKRGFQAIFVEKGVSLSDNVRKGFKAIYRVDEYLRYFHNLKDRSALLYAVKRGELLRKTPEGYTPEGGSGYSLLNAYNCLYDCSYCFLKGYFRSFNPVLFVNYEDFVSAIERILSSDKRRPLYFYAGTFSDSLALVGLDETLKRLVRYFLEIEDDVYLELRTKSDRISFLLDMKPSERLIVAFTLAPQKAVERYERLTPSLDRRLRAIKTLDDAGYRIGVRLDPIFTEMLDGYEPIVEFIESLKHLHSVELGFCRFEKKVYEKLQRKGFFANLEFRNGMYRTPSSDVKRAMNFFSKRLKNFYLSMEQV